MFCHWPLHWHKDRGFTSWRKTVTYSSCFGGSTSVLIIILFFFLLFYSPVLFFFLFLSLFLLRHPCFFPLLHRESIGGCSCTSASKCARQSQFSRPKHSRFDVKPILKLKRYLDQPNLYIDFFFFLTKIQPNRSWTSKSWGSADIYKLGMNSKKNLNATYLYMY